MTPCAWCGKPFTQTHWNRRYHTKTCKDQAGKPPKSRLIYGTCRWCGEPFVAHATRVAVTACRKPTCRRQHSRANAKAKEASMSDQDLARYKDQQRARERSRRRDPAKTKVYSRRAYYKLKANNPNELRRRQSSGSRRRYAKLRGVESDLPTLAEIYYRDKGICQLCRRPVTLRWTFPDPRSASKDHIIPVDLGGPDTLANNQLTHLRCNMTKKVGTLPKGEQLRIVG